MNSALKMIFFIIAFISFGSSGFIVQRNIFNCLCILVFAIFSILMAIYFQNEEMKEILLKDKYIKIKRKF